MAPTRAALSMALLLAVYGLLFVGVGAYISQSRVTAQTSTDVAASGPADTAQFVGSACCAAMPSA